MTLILTALCKNGICVCADRKNLRKYDDGREEETDDRNKIYKLSDDILIYNHGVNEFKGVSWEIFCLDFKKSDKWRNKPLFYVASEFQNFITDVVKAQLKNHYISGRKDAITAGFVFSGKTSFDTNFKIYELWWEYDSSLDPQPVSLDNEGLVRSGEGKVFLRNFLNNNPDFIKPRYWKDLNLAQTKEKLNELFLIAYYEQKGKSVFSKEKNIVCIPDLIEK